MAKRSLTSGLLRKGGQSQSGVVYGKRIRVRSSSGSTPFSTRQERWYRRSQSPVSFVKTDPTTGSFILKNPTSNPSLGALYRGARSNQNKGYFASFFSKRGLLPRPPRGKSGNRVRKANNSFLGNVSKRSSKGKSLGNLISSYSKTVNKNRFGSQTKSFSGSGLGNIFNSILSKPGGQGYKGRPGITPGFTKSTTSTTTSNFRSATPRSKGNLSDSVSTINSRRGAARGTKTSTKTTVKVRKASVRGSNRSKETKGGRGGSTRMTTPKGRSGSVRESTGKRGRPRDPNAIRNRRQTQGGKYTTEDRRRAQLKAKNKGPAPMKSMRKKI